MHGLIAWFAKNDVAANILMAVVVLSGLYALKNSIPVDMFPEFEISTVQVNMALPGASPEEVEESITIRIEEAVQSLSGIKEMVSRSSEGSSAVTIEVEDGYDVRQMLDEVKIRVDAINNFPDESERPLVTTPQRQFDAIALIISGEYDALTLRRYAEDIRDEVASLPGVTQVSVDNVLQFEIAIEIPELTLRKYNITLEQIATTLRRNAIDVSAGNLKTEGGDIFIRSRGQAYKAQQYAEIPILTTQDGTLIRLGDIAKLTDEFEETPLIMRFNGKPAVEIEIKRTGEQSIIDVTTKVKDYIEAKQGSLPSGLSMTHWRDRSESIKARINSLSTSAWQGAILVIILLALFLRPAVAMWVCIGIPMSFMGAFLLMPVFGISFNLITLFAFILVLGIVVDDAIVTGENVYAHLQTGMDPEEAAIKGTQEVAIPVTFGILTTIAAFLPFAFLDGRGSWYNSIPYVIIPVLLFSLIESKLVLPAHLKHVRLRTGKQTRLTKLQQKISGSLESFIKNIYQPVLVKVLEWRYASWVFMFAVLLIIIGAISSGMTKFIWFPRVQSEIVTVTLVMPAGTAFESTDRIVTFIADQATKLKEKYRDSVTGETVIQDIHSVSGGRNSSVGRLRIELTPPEKRTSKVSSQDIIKEMRLLVGQVAGAEQLNYRAEIGPQRTPIRIELRSKNSEQLMQLSERLKSKLNTFSAVFDVEDSLSKGKEELQLLLKPEATLLGLDLNTIARQVRQAVYGFEVQRVQRGREEVRVMLRYPLVARQSIETLEQMTIKLPNNKEVPLWQVATVKPGLSPSSIRRIDRQRTLSVTADFDKKSGDLSAMQDETREFLNDLLSTFPGADFEMAGEARDQQESSDGLSAGLLGLLIAIYVLLAIPFKSYVQPFIVMSVIPFGMVGAVIGHWIMGIDMSLLSMMGILALSGVVVNDSLVLVDFINTRRKKGDDVFTAVYAAGGRRFRPVILTSITTFAGLMPLLFDQTTQAQFLIPMAVSLGFGILFATIITLFLIPVNYMILEDIRAYFKRYKKDMTSLVGQLSKSKS
ncbi:MAG: multidrug efflux pump subunit AcrB [Enterobacterales bacterium]|jgi:multidrug efflux pump subunit AcrB